MKNIRSFNRRYLSQDLKWYIISYDIPKISPTTFIYSDYKNFILSFPRKVLPIKISIVGFAPLKREDFKL